MNLAIIPARGGSKRIPRKNIKEFNGKPLIWYSIEAAKKAKCFDRIIVSTDDKEIAKISQNYGAEVPFLRSEELSDDFTPIHEVIKAAIFDLDIKIGTDLNVCCIYATAPLMSHLDIIAGLNSLQHTDFDFIFAASKFSYPIQRAFKLTNKGSVKMFEPKNYMKRSQDLTVSYHDAGQFCWGTCSSWLKHNVIFSNNSSIIELDPFIVQDIDDDDDWLLAEKKYRLLNDEPR